jgi:hypothetical protein
MNTSRDMETFESYPRHLFVRLRVRPQKLTSAERDLPPPQQEPIDQEIELAEESTPFTSPEGTLIQGSESIPTPITPSVPSPEPEWDPPSFFEEAMKEIEGLKELEILKERRREWWETKEGWDSELKKLPEVDCNTCEVIRPQECAEQARIKRAHILDHEIILAIGEQHPAMTPENIEAIEDILDHNNTTCEPGKEILINLEAFKPLKLVGRYKHVGSGIWTEV